MAMGKRFGKWPEKVTERDDRLDIPLKTRKPTVFSIWNDLFHEDVDRQFQNEALGIMMDTDKINTFLILTKRPNNMKSFLLWATDKDYELRNIWFGTTLCNQPEADEKIPQLLQVPGHKWLSIEPMLESINIYRFLLHREIEGVVVGCETGPYRRPCKLEWIRSVVDQCKAAGVPVFVKQIEAPVFRVTRDVPNEKRVVHELEEFPPDLRVRELPWRIK
jgi:protein gp37